MNPWYEQLVEDCMAEHDRVCINGAECSERETHTTEAYVYVALRERVEALQGQAAHAEAREKEQLLLRNRNLLDALTQAEARIKAVRDVLDRAEAAINRHPAYTWSGQRMDPIVNGADIRRALDGDQ